MGGGYSTRSCSIPALLASFVPAALLAAAVAATPAPPQLECRLTAAPSVAAGSPVLVKFAVKNSGSRPLSVLVWQTPLEGLLGDVFRVTQADGTVIPYHGTTAKRGDPESDEYNLVPPQREASGEVDVALAYDLSRPGRYTISFRGALVDVAEPREVPRPRDRHRALPLSCPALELEISPKR
jgi:hypothetical protein